MNKGLLDGVVVLDLTRGLAGPYSGMMLADMGATVIKLENPKGGDIVVNVCKRKQMSNMRASGSDDALRLVPPVTMSLEQCLEFIADDELLEVTPQSLRVRKKILDSSLRAKADYRKKMAAQQEQQE